MDTEEEEEEMEFFLRWGHIQGHRPFCSNQIQERLDIFAKRIMDQGLETEAEIWLVVIPIDSGETDITALIETIPTEEVFEADFKEITLVFISIWLVNLRGNLLLKPIDIEIEYLVIRKLF